MAESHEERLRKAAAYQRTYRAAHPERVRESSRRSHRKHGRKWQLKKKYGITQEEHALLIVNQGGRCAICKREFANWKDTHVDHNHDTGQIRGVLCGNCNLGIGKFHDSSERLRAAADYLDFWTG